ncbi:MAG: SpoIIIAH-like family protein [Lachnospiraceae bacterium]|nr:SpoIIIAH-like family protein [Lachnospiraceae bacterium]
MEVALKGIWKKNQIIITALVLMVAVAGYLNFTGNNLSEGLDWAKLAQGQKDESVETVNNGEDKNEEEEQNKEVADTTDKLIDEGKDTDSEVGEAVLTSAKSNQAFYSIKLQREQTRAENKEMLTEIINNVNATEKQKNEAIDSIMEIADFAEKENAAETLLSAKGFPESVVSMEKNHVDVVINQKDLTEQDIIQIEDIVTRKTEVSLENIVISTAKEK